MSSSPWYALPRFSERSTTASPTGRDRPELQSLSGERSVADQNLRVWSGPDDLFNDAERLVARFKTSRSELYARAIAEFVARHDNDAVTQAFDELGLNINADPSDTQMTTATALAVLRQVEW